MKKGKRGMLGSDTLVLLERYYVSRSQKLGDGSSATVYKGLDRTSNRCIAVKIYESTSKSSVDDFKRTIRVSQMLEQHAQQGLSTLGVSEGRRVSCNNELVLDAIKQSGHNTDLSNLMASLDISSCFVKLLDHSRTHKFEPGVDAGTGLLFIIQELGGISLEQALEERLEDCGASRRMDASELKDLFWSLVCITWGLHVCGYVHMDIKPLNIVQFQGDDGKHAVKWKLIDLDGAIAAHTQIAMDSDKFWYTPVYMPPEVARAICLSKGTAQTPPRPTPKVASRFASNKGASSTEESGLTASRLMDVWSVAMCIMQAIFLTPVLEPWYLEWKGETGNDEKFLQWLSDYNSDRIVSGDLQQFVSDIDPELCNLLDGMLRKDPKNRFCIARCLTHGCFAEHRDMLLGVDELFRKLGEKDSQTMETADVMNAIKSQKSATCEVM